MLLTLHLWVVIATIALVLFSDEQALMWFLGKKEQLSASLIEFLHNGVTIGFGLVIITGGLLYIAAPAAYLSSPTFIAKMIAVAALIINTYFIDRFSEIALSRPYALLSRTERVPLFVSGVVSVVGWSTALLCGYFLG